MCVGPEGSRAKQKHWVLWSDMSLLALILSCSVTVTDSNVTQPLVSGSAQHTYRF